MGEFIVDLQNGELLKGRDRVEIQKKPFDLLLALLERPGELVLREELYARLWPGVAADYRRGLDTAVKKLRRALGDSESNPLYLETLPRRGYRLIARVCPVGDRAIASAVPSSSYAANPAQVAPDSEVERLYLQGYHCLFKRTPDALRLAHSYFERARQLEPSNSRYWTATAQAYTFAAVQGVMRPVEAIGHARRAAARALVLNRGDRLATVLIEWARGACDFELRSSTEALERLVAEDPRDRWAVSSLAFMLVAMGRLAEAREAIETTHALDPISPNVNAMRGFAAYFTGEYAEAERLSRAAVERDPEFGIAHFYYGQVLLATGSPQLAIEQLRIASGQMQETSDVMAMLGYAYAAAGQRGRAQEIDERLEEASKNAYVDAYHRAVLRDSLGERDAALALLEQAAEDHCHWFALAAVDPKLCQVREDPRFAPLLSRLRR